MLIEVAISTLNDGFYNIKIRPEYNYIIIHQITNDKDYQSDVEKLPQNVRYISSTETGLSKSRNQAIKNTNAEYLWVMDDDVEINDMALDYIKKLIKEYAETAILVVSHSHKDIEYISELKNKKLNKISSASISSIDMILKVNVLDDIKFNENFGLGAKYVSGEEYIFACNILDNGFNIIKTQKVCSYHPFMSSGQDFYSTKIKLKTKLEMFKLSNGFIKGNLLYILFCLKKIKVIYRNRALLNIIKAFF
ncbi:glycosyltransferase [Photobacterium iliopiscarium]|jgi:hypothetical protein|uniref:Glycosyltransferase family 2 protein n=1 Tax=Photobacterium iliopiscarium TaxID=56192 RepID=A0A2T3MP31_9GAMM|nr:glycosyltransferase [Photobacterium iliopiscarium]PSV98578.1 glycosyltransferase family 2 protein [Photobacterium iliopiscarium]